MLLLIIIGEFVLQSNDITINRAVTLWPAPHDWLLGMKFNVLIGAADMASICLNNQLI